MKNQKNTPISKGDNPFLPLVSGIDYELLDCGAGRKLERFGEIMVDRPEFFANWPKKLGKYSWEKADWHFYEEKGKKGVWTNRTNAPEEWYINYHYQENSLQFKLKITAFKHLGIFPEQAENWKFIQRELLKFKGEVNVLNLFAYTGAASLVAAKCGANVTNVDSVKQVVNWAKENASVNHIDTIRWMLDDARKYVVKAGRRGDKFQGVIMDPPAFGLGTNRETWKIENDLKGLLEDVSKLLHPKKHFFIINTYSPKISLKKLESMMRKIEGFPTNYAPTTLGVQTANHVQIPLGNLIRFST